MKECNACGSPFEGDPQEGVWTCAYCKTVNYNAAFLQKRIGEIDFKKTHNLLRVGLTAYEAGDFPKTIEVLGHLLAEDSSNVDAWVYSALAIAFLADMSNYESSAKKVESYIRKAEGCDSGSTVLSTGRSVCANALGHVALRMIERQYEEAEKAWLGYESVDLDKAKRRTVEELDIGFRYAGHAFSLNPDDLQISGRIALRVILNDRLYKGINPHKEIVAKATSLLETVKQKNPTLYAKFMPVLSPPKQKSGCGWKIVGLVFIIGAIGLFCGDMETGGGVVSGKNMGTGILLPLVFIFAVIWVLRRLVTRIKG